MLQKNGRAARVLRPSRPVVPSVKNDLVRPGTAVGPGIRPAAVPRLTRGFTFIGTLGRLGRIS